MSGDTHILELSGLKKSFGALSIIQGVDLQVARGSRHAIIGPNGAGKSTLFNLISGAFPPTAGGIALNGRSIAGLAPAQINRLGLSRSFQITNVFAKQTVLDNVLIGVMARHGVRFNLWQFTSNMKELRNEAIALLADVRLDHRAETLASDLAYSELRALEIGMTLATGPEIILLDEPTAGMSREETSYIVGLIRRLTEGKTLLMVEHDMGVVFDLCDEVSVLVYGKVLMTGAPAEVRANREVQAAYLGEEAI
ncbi:amino acid/amide ABC transporter ATP-binding protein 1, HAAT family [Roseovarius lutimaris]|uniref:Amino acid/amide ABC transporter ATP-binding protein 1, HAAT family n=1 Tax=Roseovarius lutimaris TaxID=1005928 RepID=A0A1I5GP74_9RHOB|nr:ABC transporter ATP-binding protein [Roseovarius lutimaris]SFO37737.1 amino acid/amide ABC transporter ATP-binding protein 1, HAAT family [Roseovarius lutimaris]